MSHLDELLSVYLDGETTPAESKRVRRHLVECERCRRQLTELNHARSAMRSLPTLELPAFLLVDDRPVRPLVHRRSVWVGAAAAVAAAVITVATVVTSPPEPLSLSEVSRQIGARASLDAGTSSLKLIAPGPDVDE